VFDLDTHLNGGLLIIRPHTAAGQIWLGANAAAEPWQWLAGAVAVESGQGADLIRAAWLQGLTISRKGVAGYLDDNEQVNFHP
jgi:hypothetical protein